MARVALVLVSHSADLARGVAEVAAQMAPDVRLLPAGGAPDGGIGTDPDRVEAAVVEALTDGDVVILTDLGSAVLTAESVVEVLEVEDRVAVPDAPLVEGAVAAAVAAQQGGDRHAVAAAARAAGAPTAAGARSDVGPAGQGPVVRRVAVVADPAGLHARPAALLARIVADRGVPVRVGGADATSVLALLALGATGGAAVDVEASGPGAVEAVDAVVAHLERPPS